MSEINFDDPYMFHAPQYQSWTNTLSKRELFSAMLMQGMISNGVVSWGNTPQAMAKAATEFADAMLAELEKKGGEG